MKDFIKPPKSRDKIDEAKVDLFIEMFNKRIAKGRFSMNNALDSDVPYLNDTEFEAAQEQARKNGYLLSKAPDNYQTTSYYLKPMI